MTVHFIGAGPGAPDLLTLRGRDLIAASPVCLYAGSLIPQELLRHCPEGARMINTAPLSLDDIIAEIANAHAQGLDVARLHSGDLSVWSAMGEQLRRLRALDIPYDITPGVPSFAAGAAALGAPARVQVRRGGGSWWHPGRHGVVTLGPKAALAEFGELHPRVLRAFDVKGPAVAFTLVPSAVPSPWHSVQTWAVSTVRSLATPVAHSSSVSSIGSSESSPCRTRDRGPRERAPPPKKASMMSPKPMLLNGSCPPPAPPPPPDDSGSPPRSTTWRLAGSDSTS